MPPEYSRGFSKQLIGAAEIIKTNGLSDVEAKRTVLYLSLLSIEISLKAIMEKVSIPISRLRSLSHNHKKLLRELEEKCEIEVEITPGNKMWVPTSRIRSISVSTDYRNATVGVFLEAETAGASTYPNKIRYGSSLEHYPPEMMLETAVKVLDWVDEYFEKIRIK